MVLRTQNKNPYLIGGNTTGSAYAPVSYGDFVENTKTPVASTPSISYAEGTNNYGAGTGNYITPSQTVDTTYTQALGAVIPTSTPTNDYTPYNGGGGTIVLDTKTGETKVVDNGTGGTGLPEGVKPVQVTPPIGTPPEDIDPNKVTLDQHYKNIYETGLANAEKAKQQAIINAKGQYNEFINPYGVQAEQQARMGLMGGGYSEYLKGKAYEGMIDTQNQARSDYAKTQQSLYSDYMGNMAAYNQAKQDKADATAAAKAALINNISKYNSEEALGAALDALGITDAEERKTYTDAWTKWKTENDAKVQADNYLTMQAIIDGTADVEPTEDNIQAAGKKLGLSQEEIDSWKQKLARKQYAESPSADWTADDWQSFFNKGLDENGEGEAWFDSLSDDEQEAAREQYSSLFDAATYFEEGGKPLNKNTAKEDLDKAVNDNYLTQKTKDAIQAQYDKQYNKGIPSTQTEIITKARELNPDVVIDDDAKIVDTNSGTFEITDFGKFNDSGTGKGEQDTYLNAILADLDTHIIAGDLVWVNYGKYDMGGQSLYMYIGDGKFVQVNGTVNIQNMDKIKLPSNGEYKMNKDHTDVIKFGRVTKKKK